MLLTALAVVVGASVILADPIFKGLAIALMAGEIASLLISRMAVPVLYFMAKRHLFPSKPKNPQIVGPVQIDPDRGEDNEANIADPVVSCL